MPAQLRSSAQPGATHGQMQQGSKDSAPAEAMRLETRKHLDQPFGLILKDHLGSTPGPASPLGGEPQALFQNRIPKMMLFHEIKWAVSPLVSLQFVSTGVLWRKICLSEVLKVQRWAPWCGQRQSEGSQPWGPPQHPFSIGNPHSVRLTHPCMPQSQDEKGEGN